MMSLTNGCCDREFTFFLSRLTVQCSSKMFDHKYGPVNKVQLILHLSFKLTCISMVRRSSVVHNAQTSPILKLLGQIKVKLCVEPQWIGRRNENLFTASG